MGQDPLVSEALLARARALRRDQSTPESVMWGLLRNRRLLGLKFRRQHPLGPFITDFYCDELRWGIEVDGGQHNTSEARTYDERRSAYLRAAGVTVTRFWSSDVMGEIDGVVERLVDLATQMRGGTLTPALSQRERGKDGSALSRGERGKE